MARLEKRASRSHKDLSLDLPPQLKKVDICACNPSAGKGETEDPRACCTGSLANW